MSTLSMRFSRFLFIAVAGAFLSGCGGESKLDVVKKFRAQYESFGKQLTDMAAMDPRAALRPPSPLEPKPMLKGNSVESNTAVFMFDQLGDRRAGLTKPIPLDLMLSGRVLTQIRVGTGPDAHHTGKAFPKLNQELTDGLKPRYIGAVKVLTHQPGRLVGNAYEPGAVKGVAMMFDRQTMKLVFADAVTASNDEKISFYHAKDQKVDPQGWVDSNLRGNFKKATLAKFAEGTGGIFETDTP